MEYKEALRALYPKCVRKSFDYVKPHLALKVVKPLKRVRGPEDEVGLPTLLFHRNTRRVIDETR